MTSSFQPCSKSDSSFNQGYRIIPEIAAGFGLSLTMPNPAKQFERHSWVAGYADGYIDGLEEAWARINAEIERGLLPKREKDECRNGPCMQAYCFPKQIKIPRATVPSAV